MRPPSLPPPHPSTAKRPPPPPPSPTYTHLNRHANPPTNLSNACNQITRNNSPTLTPTINGHCLPQTTTFGSDAHIAILNYTLIHINPSVWRWLLAPSRPRFILTITSSRPTHEARGGEDQIDLTPTPLGHLGTHHTLESLCHHDNYFLTPIRPYAHTHLFV